MDGAGVNETGVLVDCDKQQLDQLADLLIPAIMPLSGGTITCVTLYNEEGDELRRSLIALVHSIGQHYRVTHSANYLNKENLHSHAIAIVADGFEKLSPTARQLLFQLGFSHRGIEDFTAEGAIFYRPVSIATLMVALYPDYSEADLTPNLTLPLFICVKKHNAGKLDSHWWYYRGLCPLIAPAYCFQMDTGTVPARDSFHNLLTHFQQNPDTAAVASNVAVAAPDNYFNPLHIWQYGSFQHGLLLDWPAEEGSGYLSVIPGQYSGVRWQALQDSLARNELAGDRNNTSAIESGSTQQQGSNQPLDIYFRGLGELEPYEAIIYLAEDRVLCNEVAFRDQGRWRLDHVDNAQATTDTCNSLEELLRQRRRWFGSYIVCRARFINRLHAAFKQKEIAPKESYRLALAGMYQAGQLLLDWFFPALLFVVYWCIHQLITTNTNAMVASIFSALGLIMAGAIATQFLYCLRGKLDKTAQYIFRVTIVVQLLYITSAAVIFVFNWFADDITAAVRWQIALLLFSLPLAAILRAPERFPQIIKYFLPYSIMRPAFALLFWTYAFCNAHDNSWGTKGLHKPSYATKKSTGHNHNDYVGFRNRFVAFWLFGNSTFAVTLFISFHQSPDFLLALILGALVVNLTFSFAGLCKKQFFPRYRLSASVVGRYSSS